MGRWYPIEKAAEEYFYNQEHPKRTAHQMEVCPNCGWKWAGRIILRRCLRCKGMMNIISVKEVPRDAVRC